MTSINSWKAQWHYKRGARNSRLPRVREIRNRALQILSNEGALAADASRHLDVPWIRISHRKPFDRFHRDHLDHLDIWAGHKVLNIEWDQHDRITILSFHRGPWEDLLLGDWRLIPSAVKRGLPLIWRDFKNVS